MLSCHVWLPTKMRTMVLVYLPSQTGWFLGQMLVCIFQHHGAWSDGMCEGQHQSRVNRPIFAYRIRATFPFHHHHMDDILKSVYISILDSNDPALICPNSLLPKLTYDNPYSNIFKPLNVAPCWPSTNHNFRICCTPMLEGWHRHDIPYVWFPTFSEASNVFCFT